MAEEYLRDIYYDPNNPASFGGVEKLYNQALLDNMKISKLGIKKWLQSQDAYTLHKKLNRKLQKYRRVWVHHADEQWQADLIDMKSTSTKNKNYKWILSVIDCFSKFAWAIPLKNKSGPEVAEALKKIFNSRKPEKLQTDEGLEFRNKYFYELMKENNIKYFNSYSYLKSQIVERFIRTIEDKMYKYFTASQSEVWVNVLDKLVSSYNNSKHSTIKMTPIEASKI